MILSYLAVRIFSFVFTTNLQALQYLIRSSAFSIDISRIILIHLSLFYFYHEGLDELFSYFEEPIFMIISFFIMQAVFMFNFGESKFFFNFKISCLKAIHRLIIYSDICEPK